jgi:hypothetical protein
MAGPGVHKTYQLVSNGSDVIRLIICVLKSKPYFHFPQKTWCLTVTAIEKIDIWHQVKEDIFLLTFVTSSAKGFAFSFSVCLCDLYCKFVAFSFWICLMSRFFCIVLCCPLKTSIATNKLDCYQMSERTLSEIDSELKGKMVWSKVA